MIKMKTLLTACLLAFVLSEVSAKSTTAKAKPTGEVEEKTAAASSGDGTVSLQEASAERPQQFPFRDLPADVLRDFPGLCFGSTALRLFHIGQSWSLIPFCGVATCLVSQDRLNLIERVQDCGPQPKKNPKCKNINEDSEEQFPNCCPVFECEEGQELEYPTQEELQSLAHEAAQAAVRAQYDQAEGPGAVEQTARVVADEDSAVDPVEKSSVVQKVADDTDTPADA